jgi:O-antigen/teichoic acid export membrane protein
LLSAHALLGRLVGITVTGAAVRVALLLLLIPRCGLTGAAIAAAIAVLLEQLLTVATALRRFHVDAGILLSQVWRPVLAATAMAAVLAGTGLGWSDGSSIPTLIETVTSGVAAYTAVLLASWHFAGRPDGAETDILALLRRKTR